MIENLNLQRNQFLRCILLIFLLYLDLLWTSPSRCGFTDLLQDSESSLNLAFKKVLEAERAGANVTALIARLNEAVDLLLEANLLERNGKHDEAAEAASAAAEISREVEDQASELKNSALSNREFAFKFSIAGSAVGVSAFLFFMSRLWRRFKKYYVDRILAYKPEVAEDADT